jgi:hypothetical protein
MKRFLATLALLLVWASSSNAQTSHLNVPADNFVTIFGSNDTWNTTTPTWSWVTYQHGSVYSQVPSATGQFVVPAGKALVITDVKIKTVGQLRQDVELGLTVGGNGANGYPVFRRMLRGTSSPTWSTQQEFDFSMVSGFVVPADRAILPYLMQGNDGTTQPYQLVLSGYYTN